MTPNYIHRIWIFFCFVLSYQILLNFWLEKLTAYFNFALTVKKDTQNSCKNQLSIFHYMQKHDQFTAYFSQKSWKLQFTAQNCERRKKCRQAKDLNIAAIAYTPLASIILMAYNAYSAQSKTWKKV